MRIRKKKHADERLTQCEGYYIENPSDYKGKWNTVFPSNGELHLEIGCGKGRFITESAKLNPKINYIAVEVCLDVLVLAAEKAKKSELKNVKFILMDARNLREVFADGEIDRIYLNFSDPWPKNRHYKRRLTYKDFLELYVKVLKKDCPIYFKTDNRNLFEFSLNSFCNNDFRLKNITLDLHNSGYKGNVMTEYEERFFAGGNPIYRLEATYRG